MSDDYTKVHEAAATVGRRIGARPDVAIVLGSGLGDFTASLRDSITIRW